MSYLKINKSLNLIFDYTFVNSQYLFHFEHLVIGNVAMDIFE